MKSGFVAIVGRPNVGKSSIINAIAGQKVSIVSDKPQTTRYRIRAIINREEGQIVFVDTPGFHKPVDSLGDYLNNEVLNLLNEVDLIVFVIDSQSGFGKGDEYLSSHLKKAKPPKILVANKIDACDRKTLESSIESAHLCCDFVSTIKTSAVTGEGLEDLLKEIFKYLPEGPRFYPEDMVTDVPLEYRLAEIIREKILHKTYEEVPHAVAVEIEEMEEVEEKNLIKIYATIYVEKDSQKGIIIGRNGRMLKEVGTEARLEIEHLLSKKVFLSLQVKVKKDWRKKEQAVRMLY
ncbi:MAG: GTPase Era [Actinobacteria bacterium]|nr:GTPase Era [Actinomycetota bacterium]